MEKIIALIAAVVLGVAGLGYTASTAEAGNSLGNSLKVKAVQYGNSL